MTIARTVLGDISPERMGVTYPHEQVVVGYTGAREDLGTGSTGRRSSSRSATTSGRRCANTG